jgi:ABC-type nitrate/sulfonate/bicarbonate transport system ATPase subunit
MTRNLAVVSEPASDSGRRQDNRDNFPSHSKIHIEGLSVRFENFTAMADVSVDIFDREFVCLIGPSGCGKTTLLNTIAGFVTPSDGSVVVDGKPITGPGRDRGVVFQEYGLFPWFTVEQNVQYGPRLKGLRGRELKAISDRYLSLVHLEHTAKLYTSQLSGGMRQRVAIARVLANEPEILLMDEPFGALDEMTREALQEELLSIWDLKRRTCIFVTHSISEAIFLADRVFVMSTNPGRISNIYINKVKRPRDRTSPEYFQALRELTGQLREEISQAKAAERRVST